MKPNFSKYYRRSHVVYAAILALAALLLWLGFKSPQKTESQAVDPDRHQKKDEYKLQSLEAKNAARRKVREDQAAASRLSDADRPGTKAYVNRQFVQDPISGVGVNDFAIKHYNLSDEQIAAILNAVTDLRVQISSHVADNLEILEERGNSQRAFVYRGSEKYLNDLNILLNDQMTRIVNKEFGEASLNALMSDARFLRGGGLDMLFYINPGIQNGGDNVKTVRYEYRTKDGQPGPGWEGSAENLREGLLLDFDGVSK